MRLLRCTLLLLSGLALLMPARAHDVSAEASALEAQAEELRIQETLLQAQIRAEGSSATAHIGIAGAEARIRHNVMEVQKLEGLADIYQVSVEEMRTLAQQYADSDLFSLSELPKEAAEQGRDKLIEQGFKKAGQKALGGYTALISTGADIVEIGGRWAFRIHDVSRLRQEATAQHLRMNKVLQAIAQLQQESQREQQRIRALRELQRQFSANNDALAETNARIAALRNHRHDAPTVPRGDILGHWTLQQSVQVHGRSAPMGPPQRVQIASIEATMERGGPPRYEFFGPDKASARNGALMRCTRVGLRLDCERRVQQQACPPAKYKWAALELQIAQDFKSISGELRQTWVMDPTRDPSGCTVVQGGQGSVSLRLVPAGRP